MRRLVAEANDSDLTTIRLPENLPGGVEAFEQAAKFCYGINFEISAANVVGLYCAAECLQMTEEYAAGNLVSRTEDYLQQVALKNFCGALAVLHSCKTLLPAAEDLNIVSRCIEAVASNACTEFNFNTLQCWWAEELTVLSIDFYQRVLLAMKPKGLSYQALGSSLALYAEKSLQGIVWKEQGTVNNMWDEQRILIETIAGLLPAEKNTMSVTFLCGLLRSAIYVSTTEACRMDLERRIALQLDHATVDDLLIIPGTSADCIYGVDIVHRIAIEFLDVEKHIGLSEACYCSPSVIKICRVLDSYLAEIANEPNLSIEKFVAIPILMPRQARDVEDSLYRAVDIYLKTHPCLDELQREKVCSIMDCHRLSYEARMHAAQNNRLPVHTVVQVLYHDQLQVRSTKISESKRKSPKTAADVTAAAYSSPRDINTAILFKENEELKKELIRMKTYVKNLEKEPQGKKISFLSSVTKKLGKLNPFNRNVSKDTNSLVDHDEAASLPRRRRFSIS
ncbi:root phototropism protein 2 isoform X2 [Cryptomeria japonica]|nr:root phototropism protein 2 isoform X2 [Cryptomeria japonica]